MKPKSNPLLISLEGACCWIGQVSAIESEALQAYINRSATTSGLSGARCRALPIFTVRSGELGSQREAPE